MNTPNRAARRQAAAEQARAAQTDPDFQRQIIDRQREQAFNSQAAQLEAVTGALGRANRDLAIWESQGVQLRDEVVRLGGELEQVDAEAGEMVDELRACLDTDLEETRTRIRLLIHTLAPEVQLREAEVIDLPGEATG